MKMSWQDWKQARQLQEVSFPIPGDPQGGDGASTPRPIQPSHPEMKGAFKGPPADFRSAGKDMPAGTMHPGMKRAAEDALNCTMRLSELIETFTKPYYKDFARWLDTLEQLEVELQDLLVSNGY